MLRGGREAEQIDRLLQSPSGDDDVGCAESVQAASGLAHLIQVGDRHPGQGAGFVEVGRDQLRQRNQPILQQPDAGRIQQVRS